MLVMKPALLRPGFRLCLCTIISWFTCMPLFADELSGLHAYEEQVLHDTYIEWLGATNARDIEEWSVFLAPGAVFLPPDSPRLTTKDEIRSYYMKLFSDERFHLDCTQDRVVIPDSGDHAWSFGHCKATFSDAEGKALQGNSKWVKIWKRMSDGQWRCAMNSWNSTSIESTNE